MLKGVSIALAAAALTACAAAPLAWSRADATAELAADDLAECRRLGRDEMWRMGWERRWPPPFYDPLFMPPFYRWPRPFWFEFPASVEREHALVDFCMHSKGYRLAALPH